MKPVKTIVLTIAFVVVTISATMAQTSKPAPKLAGFAVQGSTFNLESFRGKQNVLVVFYRTHN